MFPNSLSSLPLLRPGPPTKGPCLALQAQGPLLLITAVWRRRQERKSRGKHRVNTDPLCLLSLGTLSCHPIANQKKQKKGEGYKGNNFQKEIFSKVIKRIAGWSQSSATLRLRKPGATQRSRGPTAPKLLRTLIHQRVDRLQSNRAGVHWPYLCPAYTTRTHKSPSTQAGELTARTAFKKMHLPQRLSRPEVSWGSLGIALGVPEAPLQLSAAWLRPARPLKSQDPGQDFREGGRRLRPKHCYGGSVPGQAAEKAVPQATREVIVR
ncbi:hypothetical protein P7K49_023450 [Saguinus oedipus]|uniref:Uncharacterized protein n=1 Tax=Saguinus oedipus TaxID=9490 RepID=A0ABQ9ULR9_SAGOE|nr:hypothetical protein P7K49_023450 [Saguinus oedipus]